MIESEREMQNGALVTFCEFTTDETYAMAKFVMDCLCLPWIDSYPEFYRTLEEIFYRCSKGRDMTSEQALRLAEKYHRFQDGLPTFPKIKGGSRLMAPPEKHGKDAVNWLIEEKARIWHESWEEHYIKNPEDDDDKSRNIRTVGGFWEFPGKGPDQVFIDYQHSREAKFWDEVDARQEEYDCSRGEAILAVSDYMPRAESEFQLPDPRLNNA